MDVGNDFGLQSTANLLEPLDYSVIDKDPISWKGTLLSTGFTYRVYLPGCLCMLYANVLAYNTELQHRASGGHSRQLWADFFDMVFDTGGSSPEGVASI